MAAAAGAASAQDSQCGTTVNATEIVIHPDDYGAQATRRERLTRWPGKALSGLIGGLPDCDSATVIAYLAQTTAARDVDGYCLAEDDATGFLLVPGERTYRGVCRRTTCERVNTVRDGAISGAGAVARTAGRIAVGAPDGPAEAAATAVAHGSGAAMVTGTAGNLATALGSAGGALVTALGAPVVAAAAAVTVVAVGGTVYICR